MRARRDIFFIHGFDPRPVSRRIARMQCEIRRHGALRNVKFRFESCSDHAFDVVSETRRIRVTVLDWSDIVRKQLSLGPIAQIVQGTELTFQVIRQRFFQTVCKKDWRAGIALALGFVPIVCLWIFIVAVFSLVSPIPLFGACLSCVIAALPASRYIRGIAGAARAFAIGSDEAIEARISTGAKMLDERLLASDGAVTIVSHSLGAALSARVLESSGLAAQQSVDQIELGGVSALVALQRDGCLASVNFTEFVSKRCVIGQNDVLGFFGLADLSKAAFVDFKSQFGNRWMSRLRYKHFARHFLYYRATKPGSGWSWLDLFIEDALPPICSDLRTLRSKPQIYGPKRLILPWLTAEKA